MNLLKKFNHPKFGSIRVFVKDDESWFVGKDVATALGYTNPQKAIRDHVDEEDRRLVQLADSQGVNESFTPYANMTNIVIINESGMYGLVLSSKLPSAKKFKRWVTTEVLPAIRKTGGYIPTKDADGNAMSDELILARALQITQRTLEEQRQVIDHQQQALADQAPKALFCDCVMESDDTCSVAEMAKMIEENGYPMGQKRLFEWLRDNGYLCVRPGSFFNTPYQEWVERGLFRIETKVSFCPDGSRFVSHSTRVTGKGQAFFLNLFIKK